MYRSVHVAACLNFLQGPGWQEIQSVLAVLQEVAKCQATDARLTLSDVCSTYARLKKQCREEYVMYNLAAAALSQVSPKSFQVPGRVTQSSSTMSLSCVSSSTEHPA